MFKERAQSAANVVDKGVHTYKLTQCRLVCYAVVLKQLCIDKGLGW